MVHAKKHKTRKHTNTVNILISKVLLDHSLVGEAKSIKRAQMIVEFWNQHNEFERHAGMYDQEHIWMNAVHEPAYI